MNSFKLQESSNTCFLDQNTFEHYIDRGLATKLISFRDDDRKKIVYHARTEKNIFL
jgi:hypothetical protein